ncbi:hypothetical protein D1007_00630 [Hordeum vulgare]|nr:hypothetical protein D1007_00630 [Hordeum vulgare]
MQRPAETVAARTSSSSDSLRYGAWRSTHGPTTLESQNQCFPRLDQISTPAAPSGATGCVHQHDAFCTTALQRHRTPKPSLSVVATPPSDGWPDRAAATVVP